MLDDVILCLYLHVRLLSTYDVIYVRSDIPTMLISMISSVIWNVTHEGMARIHDGLMMLLMVGKNHPVSLLCLIFMLDVYVFYDDVSCVSCDYLYFDVSWIRIGRCTLFYVCIFFELVIPCDMYSG